MHSPVWRPSRLLPGLTACLAVVSIPSGCTDLQSSPGLRFEISFPQELSSEAQDGRIILVVSSREGEEPRFQYDLFEPETQLGFGMDVEDFEPGEVAVMDGSTFGFPVKGKAF